jgi:hypothetical protein
MRGGIPVKLANTKEIILMHDSDRKIHPTTVLRNTKNTTLGQVQGQPRKDVIFQRKGNTTVN